MAETQGTLTVRHVPHLYIPRPWDAEIFEMSQDAARHLQRVLRRREGDPVTYTDGAGTVGSGRYADGGVVRGDETPVPRHNRWVTIAVAPPHSVDRARFAVEKLAELGVDRLIWLETERGEGRVPRADKARAWSISALQQSRGDRLMQISGPVPPKGPWDEGTAIFAADAKGDPPPPAFADVVDVVVLIGPEGGFAPEEIPGDAIPMSLGARVLRVETAAVVAATAVLLGSA